MHAESDGAAIGGFSVTPNDTTVFTIIPRGIYVGTSGNLSIRFDSTFTANGANVTFVAVPAGSILPIRPDMIYATNTTASNIVAIY